MLPLHHEPTGASIHRTNDKEVLFQLSIHFFPFAVYYEYMADAVAALQKQIEKKRLEIAASEQALSTDRAVLQGLEMALKTVLKTTGAAVEPSNSEGKKLRPGTDLARCYEFLTIAGKPQHVDVLLTAIGKDITKSNRVSLVGSLGTYVREHKWFTRPAPNTFGTVDMPIADEVEEVSMPSIN